MEENNSEFHIQKTIGDRLWERKEGFCVSVDESRYVLVYLSCPDSCHNVHLDENVVRLEIPSLLRRLCEHANIKNGYRANWTCERKAIGRLYANCSQGGRLRRSASSGLRTSGSKKGGCTDFARTVPLQGFKRLERF